MTDRIIHVAATIDAAHLDPLRVVLLSACRKLSAGWRLRLFVLGYDIGEDLRAGFTSAVAELPVEVEWLELELEAVRGAWHGAERGASITLYYRLFLGEALPPEVDRVLFLDADLLVLGDLAELWNSPFEGAIVQAVPDAYADRLHLPRLRRLDWSGVPDFSKAQAYFNAGVLLIDLNRWRREGVGGLAAAALWQHRGELSGRDQDALNAALLGRWKALPITWNFHELPHNLGSWRPDELAEGELAAAIRAPKIVHYIGCKPWRPDCLHMHRELWRRFGRQAGIEVGRADWRLEWLRIPQHDLHWRLERGRQAGDAGRWAAAAGLAARRPWLLATYPAWRLQRWARR